RLPTSRRAVIESQDGADSDLEGRAAAVREVCPRWRRSARARRSAAMPWGSTASAPRGGRMASATGWGAQHSGRPGVEVAEERVGADRAVEAEEAAAVAVAVAAAFRAVRAAVVAVDRTTAPLRLSAIAGAISRSTRGLFR